MTQSHKVAKENIVVGLEASSKDEVIEELAKLLQKHDYIKTVEGFKAAVKERESHMTTGIGNAIAIPHGRTTEVKQSTIAVATLSQPVDWDSLDGEPVSLVFLLAIEDVANGNEHLRMLAQLSEKLMDDEFTKHIKQLNDREALYEALKF